MEANDLQNLEGINRFFGMVADLMEYRIQNATNQNVSPESDLLPVPLVAERMGITPEAIYGWARNGHIEIDRRGRKNRVSFSQAERVYVGDSMRSENDL